jgi:hypothetical protein
MDDKGIPTPEHPPVEVAMPIILFFIILLEPITINEILTFQF